MQISALKISPNYNINDWAKLTFGTESDWQKAIDIFEDRINGRFFSIVDAITKQEYAGFVIMAIDCLIIETLQQFIEGVHDSNRHSREYFVKFLTNTSFKDFFDTQKANMFYEQFRCGILHQAELYENSRITIKKGTELVDYTSNNQGLIINRRLFHNQLIKEFKEYVSSLRAMPSNNDLRLKFKRKMDFISKNEPQ